MKDSPTGVWYHERSAETFGEGADSGTVKIQVYGRYQDTGYQQGQCQAQK